MEMSSYETEKRTPNPVIKISEKRFATLTSHTNPVMANKFLSNGLLVTCAVDKTVRLWNRVTEKELTEGLPCSVIDIVELPNGGLFGGTRDGEVVLWNEAYQLVKCIPGHSDFVISVKLLPNGNLATLSLDDTIMIWNGQIKDDLSLLFTMRGHGCLVGFSRLGMLPNGFLVTCSCEPINSKVRIWDPFHGTLIKEIPTHLHYVITFILLRNGDVAITGSKGSLHVLNFEDESRRKTLCGPIKGNMSVFIQELPDGNILIENYLERNLEVWNPESGQVIQSIKSPHTSRINSFSVSLDGQILATASNDNSVSLWSLDN